MKKAALFDRALDRLLGDMDDIEGREVMEHSADECPDPLGCTQHEIEHSDNLSTEGDPAVVKVEVKKARMPSLDGATEESEEASEAAGLTPEEAEELRKLLK